MNAFRVATLVVSSLLSVKYARCEDGPCYDELGCFPNEKPWKSFWRPFPAPSTPTQINTRLFCYTNASSERYNITLWPSISLNGLPLDGNKTTVFITHGFASSANESWTTDMKDAYLSVVDANVCLVDWSDGANHINYFKVASNTRIVGAEMARFIKWLQCEHGLNASNLHLIGHSLGSHISSYAAKSVGNVSRITGLDVAQPGFEGYDKEVRLDQDDADFVDTIHTNGAPFFPNRGLGFVNPIGDVDFYMNGGRAQPGCALLETFSTGSKLLGLSNLGDFLVDNMMEWASCNHGKSFKYFTEALGMNCPLWGLASSIKKFNLFGDRVKQNVTPEQCTADTCVPLGLYTPQFPGRGVFAITTSEASPFCSFDDDIKIVARLLSIKNSLTESTKEALKHFFTAV